MSYEDAIKGYGDSELMSRQIEENYKKAIELGREDSWIYSEIAWTYFLLGKSTEALEYMNKAKELSLI